MPRDLYVRKLDRSWRIAAAELEREPLPEGSVRKEIMTPSFMVDHYAIVAGDELEAMLSVAGREGLAKRLHKANGGPFKMGDVIIFEWEAWESGLG